MWPKALYAADADVQSQVAYLKTQKKTHEAGSFVVLVGASDEAMDEQQFIHPYGVGILTESVVGGTTDIN